MIDCKASILRLASKMSMFCLESSAWKYTFVST